MEARDAPSKSSRWGDAAGVRVDAAARAARAAKFGTLPTAPSADGLPVGWTVALDFGRSQYYYLHTSTGARSWERPVDDESSAIPRVPDAATAYPHCSSCDAADAGVIRKLTPDSPAKQYCSRKLQGEEKVQGVHWGQRKLLMNEIEFLTLHGFDGATVVYAGAAPAIHTAFMAEVLFPSMKFVLVDPRSFAIPATAQIQLRNEFFTDAMAAEYAAPSCAESTVLFISDIRTEPNDDKHVARDMANQMNWHLLMKPRASMLKFRLPWKAGITPYLAGEVYLQPYAATRSTETRLIVTSCDMREWDNKTYERQCFHFNTESRLYRYPHGVQRCGLDDSWDCASEVAILSRYFEKVRGAEAWQALSCAQRAAQVSDMSWRFTEKIQGKPYCMWRARRLAQLSAGGAVCDAACGVGWVCYPCAASKYSWGTSVGYRADGGSDAPDAPDT